MSKNGLEDLIISKFGNDISLTEQEVWLHPENTLIEIDRDYLALHGLKTKTIGKNKVLISVSLKLIWFRFLAKRNGDK